MRRALKEYQFTIPSLYGNDIEAKRAEILAYFERTFELFEKLFEPFVDDEVFYYQPDRQRHPLIFYFGHTATFYINKLMVAKEIDERINAEFESIFAIGVDEMSWDDLNSDHYQWPSLQETRSYRNAVKERVTQLIQTRPLHLPITWDDPFWWTVLMGIEHENIHIETSSVLHRQLPIGKVKGSSFWVNSDDAKSTFPKNTLVEFSASTITLGKSHEDDFYGWDNEYGVHNETFSAFKASKYLVSNGDFLTFVEEDGYKERAFWSQEGWEWLQEEQREFPHFWIKQPDSTFYYRTLFEEIPLPYNWPVDVNYHEAKAFCQFKQEREGRLFTLPTQAQWYHMLDQCGVEELTQGNIDLLYASSCAVDRYKMGELYDICGNVWQWTESLMDGFEGFEPHAFYDDFSVPTFDNMHNLIKGGSFISTGNETRRSSRYAFRRHFMQHAGFRYIQTEKEELVQQVNSYESDTQVSQYCDFHYGPDHFGVKNFAQSLAHISSTLLPKERRLHALDLGCAVGRASFELAHFFETVTGIDFSARFVQVGTHLKEGGAISYKRQIEGDIFDIQSVSLKELGFEHVAQKVTFLQGDACNLKPIITGYDLIMAVNLIDRLYEPMLFLDDVAKRLSSGGILVISSPYTWLEEFTKKEHWLGGFEKEGRPYKTIDALKELLAQEFEMLQEPIDVPFVIRETQRKYQHTLAEVSFWKKR